eukprot:TRINITY_DN22441_c0_g1_i2.p1 TRINITY_DN22441_c0_g1~~TRINITY_DN22441_c0_g1_i2.p1  ORF type:complete len:123 (-),score=7.63 TRINITY_DN22441_c0_g1_i2:256-624(-)
MLYQFEDFDGTLVDVEVKPGMSIAEAALWMNWVYEGSLTARTNCSVLILDASKFHHIIGKYKRETGPVIKYASSYVNHANETVRAGMVHIDVGDEGFNIELLATIAFRSLNRRSIMIPSTGV